MSRRNRHAVRPCLQTLERRDAPAVLAAEGFEQTANGSMPSGWSQWSSSNPGFSASTTRPFAGSKSLAVTAASNVTSRAWPAVIAPANSTTTVHVFADSLAPTEVLTRGQNLSAANATFYAASLTRGIGVQLVKSVNGVRTVLAAKTSSAYLSYSWFKLSVTANGTQISAQVYNPATGQYLNTAGGWQSTATSVLTVTDASIAAGGLSGVNRPAGYSGTIALDEFRVESSGTVVPEPEPPSAGGSSGVTQDFNAATIGGLPAGWQQSSGGGFAVSTGTALSAPRALTSSTAGPTDKLTWVGQAISSNVEVSAAVFLNQLSPAILIARGSNLNSSTPTYYGVRITRGLGVQVTRTVNGVTTLLASGNSTGYFSYQWARVTLRVEGGQVKVRVVRTDTNQALAANGSWTSGNGWFRETSDTTITSGNLVGLGRGSQYAGAVVFDDFAATTTAANTGDTQAPAVSITGPTATTVSGTVAVTATASDNIAVSRVEFWLDGQLKSTDTSTPYSWSLDTATLSNGTHTLLAKAFDSAGNSSTATRTVNVQNSSAPPPAGNSPTIPAHYSHIRIAQLAYYGTPMTSFEQGLLANSVDLVVPNTGLLASINATAPNTPQLIYTNVSNLYEGLLLDWLRYADGHGLDREAAFYHVAQPTGFSGGSSSSQPVNYLWRVARNTTDLTGAAKNGTVGDVSFGGNVGDVTYFGYPDKFRELNFAITTAAGSSWSGVWEYASAVNTAGQPTAWSALPIVSNSSNNLRQSGRVTFDPPSTWKASTASGPNQLFFVRLRVTSSGTAPVAATVLGRDYVAAAGSQSGTVPAFDTNADTNHDGYLSDAEFANRAANKTARFEYESRLFYPAYGQMRFATNPSSAGVKNWAADMHDRLLDSQPLADGVFVDNSNAKSPVENAVLVESSGDYATQYGAMLAQVGAAIAPKWILANTTGGGSYTSNVVNQVPATMEEFALRPLATTWSRFGDFAGMVQGRLNAPNSPYLVLDTHPQGGSPTDTRTQIATLAYYYLLADPQRTFLMFYGGYEPATSWTRHWVPAAAYNIGQPTGTWSEFAAGNDPSNANLTYKVFARNYSNGLVLYKPLSYRSGVTGTLADNTTTTHVLARAYRPLRADGTLGPVMTSVTLRNGEGAVLIPV